VNARVHFWSGVRSAGLSLRPPPSRSKILGADGVCASLLARTQPELPPDKTLELERCFERLKCTYRRQ
jgi:hypothetical protein